MAIDYREKVKKLLALAKSPNENEARAALLKARQIMAEHKLQEADFVDREKMKVKKETIDIGCTKRMNSWMMPLSQSIAENYCCSSYRRHASGKQYNEIGFIGFEDDFEICVAVFRYAVDCILSKCKELRREYGEAYTAKYVRRICDAYGYGFVRGVEAMYEAQNQQNAEWGLVLATPPEVKEVVSGMTSRRFATQAEPTVLAELQATLQGQADGEKFDPTRRIE